METIAGKIQVETTITAPIEKVWNSWTEPRHITQWNNASDDWHTPHAESDLRPGGKFLSRMEAKDGSFGFDFGGQFDEVAEHEKISYTMEDGRQVIIHFEATDSGTKVTELFDPESSNSLELQQTGWQAILDNFKRYTESLGAMQTLHYEITINAPVEKVYHTMIDTPTYEEWTAIFNPTSHYKGSWEKGSKILFIGSDDKGNIGGMVSRIKENIPNRFISIEHLGVLENEEEITTGPKVDGWAGACENYAFNPVAKGTEVKVSLDANQEFKDYFETTWPAALEKLKSICEQS